MWKAVRSIAASNLGIRGIAASGPMLAQPRVIAPQRKPAARIAVPADALKLRLADRAARIAFAASSRPPLDSPDGLHRVRGKKY